MIGKFDQHFIIEINYILSHHHFLRTGHDLFGKAVLWNCVASKWFHSSQSPGTPLTFSHSDEGSNYRLEESKPFGTEITNSSVKHDLKQSYFINEL